MVSRSLTHAEGARVTASPQEALHHLERKGFETALVGGGAELDSAFLSQGLVDEIFLNIEPVMMNGGSFLAMDGAAEARLRLDGTARLGDVVQLHYRVTT